MRPEQMVNILGNMVIIICLDTYGSSLRQQSDW